MPEWSKGADLSSAVRKERVGSNPTGCILLLFLYSISLFIIPSLRLFLILMMKASVAQ